MAVSTRDLLARRTALRTEMRALNDSCPDGAFSAEQAARWATLTGDADALEARIARAVTTDEWDRSTTGRTIPGADPRYDAAQAQVSYADVIRSQLGGTDTASGRAREMSQEMSRRSGKSPEGLYFGMGGMASDIERRVATLTLPAGGPAGNLVATNLAADQFIQKLYAAIRCRQLGATVLGGLMGNLDIPRLKGSTTAGWVADGSPLTASDGQFDKVSLRPKTAGVLSEVSRLAFLQSSPDVDALLATDMTRILALALDQAAIAGTGSGNNQPTGILNTAGIGAVSMGTNGGALLYATPVALMGAIQDLNAAAGSLAFLSNYKVKRAADLITTSYGDPLGEDVVFQSTPRAFTTSVPSTGTKGTSIGNCSSLIYGNFSDLLIGLWSELDILVNPYATTSFAAGNLQIRAMMSVDIAVRHPESFAAITDILA